LTIGIITAFRLLLTLHPVHHVGESANGLWVTSQWPCTSIWDVCNTKIFGN